MCKQSVPINFIHNLFPKILYFKEEACTLLGGREETPLSTYLPQPVSGSFNSATAPTKCRADLQCFTVVFFSQV